MLNLRTDKKMSKREFVAKMRSARKALHVGDWSGINEMEYGVCCVLTENFNQYVWKMYDSSNMSYWDCQISLNIREKNTNGKLLQKEFAHLFKPEDSSLYSYWFGKLSLANVGIRENALLLFELMCEEGQVWNGLISEE